MRKFFRGLIYLTILILLGCENDYQELKYPESSMPERSTTLHFINETNKGIFTNIQLSFEDTSINYVYVDENFDDLPSYVYFKINPNETITRELVWNGDTIISLQVNSSRRTKIYHDREYNIVFSDDFHDGPQISENIPKYNYIEWQRCCEDNLLGTEFSIIVNDKISTGGLILSTIQVNGIEDIYAIKIDGSGNTVWQKNIGGSSYEYSAAATECSDGGYALIGVTNSSDGMFTGFEDGVNNIFLLKIDADGYFEWSERIDINNTPTCITQTSDNGFIISYSDAGTKIAKTNSNGIIEWDTSYSDLYNCSISDIIETEDKGYIISGKIWIKDNSYDLLVFKINSKGEVVWQSIYGGSEYDIASRMVESNDGGVVIIGSTSSTDGDISDREPSDDYLQFMWVVNINSSGGLVWQKTFDIGDGIDIVKTPNDNYMLLGYSYDDFWVAAIDNSSNTLWNYAFGGSNSDRPSGFIIDDDGGLILVGSTNSTDGDIETNCSQNSDGYSEYLWYLKLVNLNY